MHYLCLNRSVGGHDFIDLPNARSNTKYYDVLIYPSKKAAFAAWTLLGRENNLYSVSIFDNHYVYEQLAGKHVDAL